MMLRSKIATFLGALIIAGSAFSAQEDTCPDINDIKAEGLNMSEQIYAGYYFAGAISTFNTETNWAFGIGPIEAEDADEALETGTDILNTITGPGVPKDTPGMPEGMMVCFYNTNDASLYAIAATEPVSPLKFKQIFKAGH